MDNKVILKIKSGSSLYGLFVEGKSDVDYLGIYLSDESELFGLNSSETIEDGVVSKQDGSNKNTKDAVDCTYHELRKFCRLCLGANPTVLEMLFVNEENIVEIDEYGKLLLENSDYFLSTKCFHSFLGYAFLFD